MEAVPDVEGLRVPVTLAPVEREAVVDLVGVKVGDAVTLVEGVGCPEFVVDRVALDVTVAVLEAVCVAVPVAVASADREAVGVAVEEVVAVILELAVRVRVEVGVYVGMAVWVDAAVWEPELVLDTVGIDEVV